MTLYATYAAHLDAALDQLPPVAGLDRANVAVEPPRDPSHGDLATNAAMVLAKAAGTNPRALAEGLKPLLEAVPGVRVVEIAGPGFINLRLDEGVWRDELAAVHAAGGDYGRSTVGAGTMVNIEYVSANPTGPMHMGHCRGAVVGDALATLLKFAGHEVIREYYVNDAGGQVDVLARSVYLRYLQTFEPCISKSVKVIAEVMTPWSQVSTVESDQLSIDELIEAGPYYPGDYLVPVGEALAAEYGDDYVSKPESVWLKLFRERAVAAMMQLIKDDLRELGIVHNEISYESKVQAAKKPEAAEAKLREMGLVYDGQLEAPKGEVDPDWEPVTLPLFRSTMFGDDQDRPIKKSDGSWTYFGADMAYHYQKAEKADALIDIWGADHAGTVKRIRAAVQALTRQENGDSKPFDVKLIQMVRLLRNGEPVKMSKRSGNFVTLADVVDEVGKDVVRFTMLTRKADAQMDFDFAKVVEASKDNPVFYVQYAHARICSIGRKFAAEGIAGAVDLSRLDAEDLELVKIAAQFPRIVESAAAAREPHRIAFYLYDLAAAFHAFFNAGNDRPERRVLMVNDPDLAQARLFLCNGIGQIIRNGLNIMGVRAAEEM
jgi:arginyl-tRNA synthetase